MIYFGTWQPDRIGYTFERASGAKVIADTHYSTTGSVSVTRASATGELLAVGYHTVHTPQLPRGRKRHAA